MSEKCVTTFNDSRHTIDSKIQGKFIFLNKQLSLNYDDVEQNVLTKCTYENKINTYSHGDYITIK